MKLLKVKGPFAKISVKGYYLRVFRKQIGNRSFPPAKKNHDYELQRNKLADNMLMKVWEETLEFSHGQKLAHL